MLPVYSYIYIFSYKGIRTAVIAFIHLNMIIYYGSLPSSMRLSQTSLEEGVEALAFLSPRRGRIGIYLHPIGVSG